MKRDFKEKAKEMWAAAKGDGCTAAPDFHFTECCLRHDKDYTIRTDENGNRLTRAQADKRLYECIKEKDRLLAPIYYAGVRLAGWFFWNRHRSMKRKKNSEPPPSALNF